MRVKRCLDCDIDYPLFVVYCTVNGCNKATILIDKETEDPITMQSEVPLVAEERIVEYNKQFWIADSALDSVGYTGLRMVGTIISVRGKGDLIYFELGGRAVMPQISLRGWWITRMPTPTEMFADLPVTKDTDEDGSPLVRMDGQET
jgi:hypothetical protein